MVDLLDIGNVVYVERLIIYTKMVAMGTGVIHQAAYVFEV